VKTWPMATADRHELFDSFACAPSRTSYPVVAPMKTGEEALIKKKCSCSYSAALSACLGS
jgi:hypothetical protein